ncbi:MAG: GH116 family glycosyl-hydrolase [bacterium]
MTITVNPNWPMLRVYHSGHLRRVALPLGGIGTGTISLGGRGDLRDWEIADSPGKGAFSMNTGAFFALYAKAGDAPAVTRALEGPIDPEDYEGASGCAVPNHGLPRFRTCNFCTAYPFAQILLADPEVPVEVRLEAFNPLIPGDADASGIPVVILRYVLQNVTDETTEVSVCGVSPHFLKADGTKTVQEHSGGGMYGVQLGFGDDGDRQASQWGTVAIATTASEVTRRTGWAQRGWNGSLLDFWDDFSEDGRLDPRDEQPYASVAAHVTIPPHSETTVTFLLTWHLPNRITWTPQPKEEQPSTTCCCDNSACGDVNNIGNYYTTQYTDAWDVAVKTVAALEQLETDTLAFVKSFCMSDLPDPVKEAALFNLSTLRSQTCFRTPDGNFYGWEGCGDGTGCCHGSCTHVWNYEQATAFLFGDLARKMRQVEFQHAIMDNGLMCFRTGLPLAWATAWPVAAADGQMGCLMKLYRDWQLCGDDDFLRALWPQAKKALAFCWIPNGWDGDQDGVMEGCQHNTMDVEYFGPNPQMGTWYLGALRCTELMARHLGDDAFAAHCADLFARGQAWVDANLFNGEFYEQETRPPLHEDNIAPGLRANLDAIDWANPEYQIGAACLVDQLVGQFLAHVCGIGYLLDADHVRTTLHSIKRYNFLQLHNHFNNMRSYALQDESAVLMATYPHGNRPKWPFPYFNEVMTGFEYTAAVHMLYEGMVDDGLEIISAIRHRYDGRKRNPFDEAECGHHYARAMASWAAVLALTGFHYSGMTGVFTLLAREGNAFWSTGNAWGTCTQSTTPTGTAVTLNLLFGALTVSRFVLTGAGEVLLNPPAHLTAGDQHHWIVASSSASNT